jgi:diguanylate cyclase (GGDEF)-like protein/PAS domain S-box-containing protein
MVDGDEVPGGGLAGGLAPRGRFVVHPEQLAALFTHIDAVVLTFDEAGVVTFITPSVRELLGFEPCELVGQSAFDFVHPDDAARLVANLDRWLGRDGAVKAENVRVRTCWGGWCDVGFETVTGSVVEPFGAGVATMRPVGDSTSIEQELRRRLVNEDRMTQLARTFMAGDADFDTCVDGALALMGSLESVDSIGIWRMQDGRMHHRHEWTAPSISPSMGDFAPFRPDSVEFGRTLARLEEVTLRATSHNPHEATDVEELARKGACSFLAAPMVTDGQLSGFVSFTSYRDGNIFAPTHRSTLRAATGIFAEAFARHEVQARLEHQARHDSLTGLANRWAFGAAVDEALRSRAAGESSGVALLLLDLDRFHVINDSLGHPVGDGLLVAMSARLQQLVEGNDVLARLGGDELVLLLTDVSSDDEARRRAEELLAAFEEPFLVGSNELGVSASVGVALARDAHVNRSQLLREADVAMYAAKRGGGRRVQIYDYPLRDEVSTRLQRERDLDGAVNRDEFVLHYQPEFDLQTGSVIGVEALLRWEHPHCGLLAPGEFIGVAEDSGHIVDIGFWVIEEALRQLREWLDDEAAINVVMRINLSGRQIAHKGLLERVTELLGVSGVCPSSVCFELTETAAITDPDRALLVLEGLKDIGVTIAVDDFGTGYSSLAYLHQFPVDLLKIDRSFVARLDVPPRDTSLVRAIISMADALGLTVTAEGIETVDQLEALVKLGCGHGQGYLLARPAPPDRIASLMAVTPRT